MPDSAAPSLSTTQVTVMATACAIAVAVVYYNQPLLPLIGATFGRGSAGTGLIATLTQVGYAVGLILFVPLGDRLNRKSLILSLLLANIIGLAGCALAPGFATLSGASVLLGLTAVSAQIIIPAVSGLVQPEKRGRAVGALLSGLSAGLLFARALSGLVGAQLGWRAMFGLATGLDAVLMLVIWRMLPATLPTTTLSYPRLLASLGAFLRRDGVLRAACATGFLMFGGFSALWGTLAALLARPPYGFGPDIAGAFGIVGIAGLLASPLIGRLTDRFGTRPVLAAGALIVTAAFACVTGAGHTLIALVAGMILLDIGNRAGLVANQTRVFSLAPEARSRLNTVFMAAYFLGGAAGSWIGANAAAAFGWAGLAMAGGALAVLALVLHLVTTCRTA